jgi:predicted Zn-dependent peptidase
LPAGRTPRFVRAPRQIGPARLNLHTHDTEQTHLALGFHAFGRNDERRYALKLLSVLLGENMSSRLFQKLRERHGYCYSINSSTVTLADAGAIHIYAGLDHEKLERAVKMILRELESICHRAPTRTELRKAQDYTIGQTLMGLESTTTQMMWVGESLMGYGWIHDPSEIEAKISRRATLRISSAAPAIACTAGDLGVAVVGPEQERARVESWLG